MSLARAGSSPAFGTIFESSALLAARTAQLRLLQIVSLARAGSSPAFGTIFKKIHRSKDWLLPANPGRGSPQTALSLPVATLYGVSRAQTYQNDTNLGSTCQITLFPRNPHEPLTSGP